MGICIIDEALTIFSWNKILSRWTCKSYEVTIRSSLLEHYPHLRSRRFLDRIQSVFENHQPCLFSPSIKHPFLPIPLDNEHSDGWMLQKTVIEILGDQKQFAQICVSDVTTQYRQIQKLRIEKEQHRLSRCRTQAILDCAADAIITINENGLIEEFNRSAEQMFGYKSSELLGRNINVLMPSPIREEHDGYLKNYLQTNKPSVIGTGREVLAQRKDGTTFPLFLSVSEVVMKEKNTTEKIRRFTGIMRDLTEEKRRESELKAARKDAERLSAFGLILDRSLNEIYIFDAETFRFVHVNKGAQENTGYTMEEYRNLSPLEISLDYAPDSVMNLVEPLRNGTEDGIKFTTMHRRKDQSHYPVEVYLEAAHLGPRQVYVAVILDITERQEVEMELRQASENALCADRSKSEFLANMSHEIRTPMTAILGFNDILLENLVKPENIDAAETIKRNGNYLINLINDILDLSKVEAGKFDVECIECSPLSLVNEVISLLKVKANAKNILISSRFEGAIPKTIMSDPTRIRQILINIAGNAIKFTESGSVEIVVRLLADVDDEPKLQFDVIDTGIGIPDDKIENMFLPFTQADNSTTREFGGTGLGLTICKSLVKLLGGDLSVSSKPGEGSKFSITVSTGPLKDVVPIKDHSESTAKCVDLQSTGGREKPLQNRRILLAEDGPDNQRLISWILKKEGAKVVVADNGQIAFDLASKANSDGCPFDTILMDMHMPLLDGYEATRGLRNSGYTSTIIALTALSMVEDRQKCLQAGCDDFATKPIDRKKLIGMILEHIERKEDERGSDIQSKAQPLLD